MSNDIRVNSFNILPPVIKNLLILNGLFFLATIVLRTKGIDLNAILGLHYMESRDFHFWQFITYMFMHDTVNFSHIFFNMFALWMFGSAIENTWGGKRFLLYYFVTGIGAAIVQVLVCYIRIKAVAQDLPPEAMSIVQNEGYELLKQGKNYVDHNLGLLNLLFNSVTIGASGAVFGILLAFGMMFPDAKIYVYFLIPIKAKWFVIIYGALEFFSGLVGSSDGVAHFAHLGGMLFGLILILMWRKQNGPRSQNNY